MGNEGEQQWLEAALDRYEAPLLRYAASVVGRAAASDVVQDTFLALCRAEREQISERLAPWLFTVCRHRALDCLRQGRRLEPLEEEEVRGNVNRVLLATDGDFNVGVTSQSELVELVQREAKSGVFSSVLGFGDGNYQDAMLEKLADKGNGNYAYIDEPAEAQKVLVEQATGTLLTLAKDVKLQLEFNPGEVAAFRLIGYENRMLEHPDFNDDTKDAGELGADHSVTALYELIPAGSPVPGSLDALKFQPVPAPAAQTLAAFRGQLLQLKVRYQAPSGGPSQLLEQTVRGPAQELDEDFRFAAAVAEFGLLLRESPHRGDANYAQVLKLAQSSLGDGRDRRAREQFLELVRKARRLSKAAN